MQELAHWENILGQCPPTCFEVLAVYVVNSNRDIQKIDTDRNKRQVKLSLKKIQNVLKMSLSRQWSEITAAWTCEHIQSLSNVWIYNFYVNVFYAN